MKGNARLAKTEGFAAAKVTHVIPAIDAERLREFAGTGAESGEFRDAATFHHLCNASGRLQRSKEHESILRAAPHENVQEPVNAVVEIDVSRPGRMRGCELPDRRAHEDVGRLIVHGGVRFGL